MKTSGFTYIETLVSIGLMFLIASIVYPNVVTESRARNHRFFKQTLISYAIKARNRAIDSRQTVSLGYDKSGRFLEIVEEDANQASKPFADLNVPDQISTEKFYADKYESPVDGWRVPFTPDGKTTGGGIQFQDDQDTYSFLIDRFTGQPSVISGPLPNFEYQSWSAGGLQKRVQ